MRESVAGLRGTAVGGHCTMRLAVCGRPVLVRELRCPGPKLRCSYAEGNAFGAIGIRDRATGLTGLFGHTGHLRPQRLQCFQYLVVFHLELPDGIRCVSNIEGFNFAAQNNE